jgi:hypothetical protein
LWTRQWGTSENDSATAVVGDADNNVFVAGYTEGKLGAAQPGTRDVFLTKWRADHSPEWTTQWGSAGSEAAAGIARSAAGELWVCGNTYGNLKGTNAGDSDAFVSKLSATGSVVWSIQLGTLASEDGNHVAVDASGSAFLVGTTGAKLGSDAAQGGMDVFVAKISAAGAVQWLRQWGTASDDGGHDIAVLPDGDLMIVGFTYGTLPGATGSGGGFLARLDPEGRPRWTRQLGALAADTANALALGPGNRVYVAGVTSGSMVPNGARGLYDAFLQARDLDGQVLWTKQAGTADNEFFRSVAVDATGTVYGAGTTPGSFPGFTLQGLSDHFLIVVPP